jgi:hypothetical protein
MRKAEKALIEIMLERNGIGGKKVSSCVIGEEYAAAVVYEWIESGEWSMYLTSLFVFKLDEKIALEVAKYYDDGDIEIIEMSEKEGEVTFEYNLEGYGAAVLCNDGLYREPEEDGRQKITLRFEPEQEVKIIRPGFRVVE